MQLEDYFDFLAPNDIRVKGTRIGIETILTDYLELGLFAEQIAARYPSLSSELRFDRYIAASASRAGKPNPSYVGTKRVASASA